MRFKLIVPLSRDTFRSITLPRLADALILAEKFVPPMGKLGMLSSIDDWTYELEILDSTGGVYKTALITIEACKLGMELEEGV